MDDMKQALQKRRGKGLDLTILLGGEPLLSIQQDDKNGNGDLAPTVKDKPGMLGGDDQTIPGQDDGTMSSDGNTDDSDAMMTSDMSDYDKQDLMNRKPRSLGDRARMDAMNRMKK